MPCVLILFASRSYLLLEILEGGYDLRPTSACDGEGNGTPTPVLMPENPTDGGVW